MRFFSVRELRTSSKAIWDTLANDSEVIITNNGKPAALMLKIDESSLEDCLAAIRQAKAMRALTRMQLAATTSGVSSMSLEEINAEITSARAEENPV